MVCGEVSLGHSRRSERSTGSFLGDRGQPLRLAKTRDRPKLSVECVFYKQIISDGSPLARAHHSPSLASKLRAFSRSVRPPACDQLVPRDLANTRAKQALRRPAVEQVDTARD